MVFLAIACNAEIFLCAIEQVLLAKFPNRVIMPINIPFLASRFCNTSAADVQEPLVKREMAQSSDSHQPSDASQLSSRNSTMEWRVRNLPLQAGSRAMASNEKYFAELDGWKKKAVLDENRGAAVNRIKAWIDHADPDIPLDLSHLSLTSLPPHLPPRLKTLNIRNNKLQHLPESLAATDLEYLDAFCNELSGLPKKWPPRLLSLNIARNELTYLSKSLPEGLRHLYAYDNELPCLPEPLPAALETLEVGGNELTKLLKNWPPGLKHLDVRSNLLTCLRKEDLPVSLLYFHAYNNKLISVPDKWPPELVYLDVSCNQLTKLSLPDRLQKLIASGNRLKCLSDPLPARLRELDVSDNQLTVLLELPDSLWNLSVKGNCLDHLPESLFSMLARAGRINVENNPLSDQVRERYKAEVRARSGSSSSLEEAVSKWNRQTEGPKTNWSRFNSETGAMEFVRFLDRLRLAVDTWKDDPEFNKKTVEWLDQLASDAELRTKTFHLAFDATANCQDRVSLTFNAMKKARIANDVRKGKYDENPEKLISLARGMFRLDVLEKIAYEKAKSPLRKNESVEVYLAYQVKLRDKLKLPLDTLEILHFNVSELTEDDLIEAEKKVKKDENDHFLYYLSAEWDPWESVLERMDKHALDEARNKVADIEKSFEQRLNAGYAELQRKVDKAATTEEKAFYQQAIAALPAKLSKEIAYPIKEELTRAFMQKQNIPLSLLDSPWERSSDG